jgi:hypothetical protein
MNTKTNQTPWYYECSECMKKFSKDYDTPHVHKKMKTPKDKYNVILTSIFSTNLYCMGCAHNHAHRVYYNLGNPQPYNVEFLRQ